MPTWHGEGGDIFERLYAVRLDRLRAQDLRALLSPMDTYGLLQGGGDDDGATEGLSEEELLKELEGMSSSEDITELKHVRPTAGVKAAEEITNRKRCEDFDDFKALFRIHKRNSSRVSVRRYRLRQTRTLCKATFSFSAA